MKICSLDIEDGNDLLAYRIWSKDGIEIVSLESNSGNPDLRDLIRIKKTLFDRLIKVLAAEHMTILTLLLMLQLQWDWKPHVQIGDIAVYAAKTADVVSSQYAFRKGCIESNPLMPEHVVTMSLVQFGTGYIINVFANTIEKTGKPKLAWFLRSLNIGMSVGVSVHNVNIAKQGC